MVELGRSGCRDPLHSKAYKLEREELASSTAVLGQEGQLKPECRKVKNGVFHCPPQREKLESFFFHGS